MYAAKKPARAVNFCYFVKTHFLFRKLFNKNYDELQYYNTQIDPIIE